MNPTPIPTSPGSPAASAVPVARAASPGANPTPAAGVAASPSPRQRLQGLPAGLTPRVLPAGLDLSALEPQAVAGLALRYMQWHADRDRDGRHTTDEQRSLYARALVLSLTLARDGAGAVTVHQPRRTRPDTSSGH